MDDAKPMISIILPVYNGSKFLAKCIESCLNQTYDRLELIVVNDCSTDDSLEIMEHFAQLDDRIRIVNNESNKKLPASLNVGHNAAKGRLLTWISHDNLYHPNALMELSKPILSEGFDIVYSNLQHINEAGIEGKAIHLPEIESLIFGNCVAASFLYRKEVFQRNKGYNENLFLVEDYDFWLRAFLHSRYKHLEQVLYKYRIQDQSLTSLISKQPQQKMLWKNNIQKMYANFCQAFAPELPTIPSILYRQLVYEPIDFKELRRAYKEIDVFKEKLKKQKNGIRASKINNLFLRRMIKIMVENQTKNKNFSNCLFLLRKNLLDLDKNSLKTLIKYALFK